MSTPLCGDTSGRSIRTHGSIGLLDPRIRPGIQRLILPPTHRADLGFRALKGFSRTQADLGHPSQDQSLYRSIEQHPHWPQSPPAGTLNPGRSRSHSAQYSI